MLPPPFLPYVECSYWEKRLEFEWIVSAGVFFGGEKELIDISFALAQAACSLLP